MATGADPVFVDTNILIYANVPAAPEHLAAQTRLQDLARLGAELWVSRQVFREYLAALTRPQTFTNPIGPDALAVDILRFESQFRVAEDGPAVTVKLLELLRTTKIGGKQVHDANIVATMEAYGLGHLLTHNVADFQRFASRIAVIPLLSAP
jgi:predicted nucleic acid-binding protein